MRYNINSIEAADYHGRNGIATMFWQVLAHFGLGVCYVIPTTTTHPILKFLPDFGT